MKNLMVEYTAFDYGDFAPNKRFFKELSAQITPQISSLVTEDALRVKLADMICFAVDTESYLKPIYFNGVNSMIINISARRAPLIIFSVMIKWYAEPQSKLMPWDDIQGKAINFESKFTSSQVRALNNILPQLYHPVIKSKESGLSFDYQIYYGGDSFIISTYDPVSKQNIERIHEIINENLTSLSSVAEIKKSSEKQIKIHIKSDKLNRENIEAIIRSFDGTENIKRIIFK